MIVWLRHVLGWLRSAFCAREDLLLENLALRQQLLALHAQRPRRRLTASHKLFWVVLRKRWDKWKEPLILATPRTSAAGTFRLVTFPYMGCRPHILHAHPGIVVPLCSKRDLSTFFPQIANSTLERSSFNGISPSLAPLLIRRGAATSVHNRREQKSAGIHKRISSCHVVSRFSTIGCKEISAIVRTLSLSCFSAPTSSSSWPISVSERRGSWAFA